MTGRMPIPQSLFKTIDEVIDQRGFVALPTELQHRLAMLAGIEPATYEVDVLRYGSQLCIGGDEVVFRGWLPSEPAIVFSTRGRDGGRTRMYSKSAVAVFCKSPTKWSSRSLFASITFAIRSKRRSYQSFSRLAVGTHDCIYERWKPCSLPSVARRIATLGPS